MNYSKYIFIIITGSILGLFCVVSTASDEEFEVIRTQIVEGTDPEYEAEFMQKYGLTDISRGLEPADIQTLKDQRTSMQQSGYILAPDDVVNLHTLTFASEEITSRESVVEHLGFQPAAFQLGLADLGVIPEISEDGKVHDLITLLRHPRLGQKSIRERSLATEPRGRMAKYIYGPKFDIVIDESSALLTAYRQIDGDRGKTDLTVLSESKLATISVGMVVTKDDSSYQDLLLLASQL